MLPGRQIAFSSKICWAARLRAGLHTGLFLFAILALVTITARRSQPDGQSSTALPAGVADGTGVALGGGVKEADGAGVLVLASALVAVGVIRCVPVTET